MVRPKAETVYLIRRLSSLMNQRIDEVLKAYGMARSQFQVLYLINESGSLTQKELLEVLRVEPATLSGLIDTLEHKEFVKRSTITSDKRSKKLELTTAGRNIVTSIPHPGLLVEATMFEGIKKSDREIFKQVTARMIINLESNELTK